MSSKTLHSRPHMRSCEPSEACHALLQLRYKTLSGWPLDRALVAPDSNTLLTPAWPRMYQSILAPSVNRFPPLPSLFFFLRFEHKSKLLSYLVLCVAKMPFIPPVSIARSVSGLTGKEKPINISSSTTAPAKTKFQRDDKGGSVKERLASNLKQLGKKSQPRSHLPTANLPSGADAHAKRRGRLLPSSKTESIPASSSGESLSKTEQHKHVSQSSVKSEPDLKSKARHQEEARFTLTLTPEAVLLLQRRNSERRQHSASRNAGSGGGVSGSTSDSRRRRDNVSKRHQAVTPRHSTSNRKLQNNSDTELRDIRSIVKISLLNEQHKYDDVEYEEEQDYGVDERVVLKCTEWLHGLENIPVTVGNSLQAV